MECKGVGLHSGAPVSLKIVPAAAGSGIVFRRTDLDGFEIEAIGRNVARVSYATSLQKQGVLISTTEHLLSAFIGIGLDNAVVELDNLEVPILDGSARPFVEMVLQAGLRKQRKKRTYLRIIREIEVRDGNKFIGAYPASGYAVAYKINFAAPIGAQSFEIDLSQDLYRKELAAARTFGFLSEEKAMKNMGLIRGATEDNVIVLTADGVKNGPLRFEDEFVRHKVLDLIGDLALAGRRIQGRVVAEPRGRCRRADVWSSTAASRSQLTLQHRTHWRRHPQCR